MTGQPSWKLVQANRPWGAELDVFIEKFKHAKQLLVGAQPAGAGAKTGNIKEYKRIFWICFIENEEFIFMELWLFLRSLSCIGSSGRLV